MIMFPIQKDFLYTRMYSNIYIISKICTSDFFCYNIVNLSNLTAHSENRDIFEVPENKKHPVISVPAR
jgi:hypothetical protein